VDAAQPERVYSAYSRVYDRVFGKVFQDSREALAATLDALPGQRVLEIGVGTGLTLPLYPGEIVDGVETILREGTAVVRITDGPVPVKVSEGD